MTLPPLAARSIGIGLSCVGDSGRTILRRLIADAQAAEAAGFDGVTLSEHHGGFAHYLPTPLLVAAHLLGQLDNAWAIACPAILPLRDPVLVAEDLAWLEAAHPGRVGAGFAPGYQQRDFDLFDADFAARRAAYWTGFGELVRALGSGAEPSPLKGDPAVDDLGPAGLPLVAGVGGPVGVRRAARLGVGLLLTSLRAPDECRDLVRAYRAAGGARPVVLIRRVHVGAGATGFAASESAWRRRSDGPSWLRAADGALVTGPADAVAAGLMAALRASDADALNIRLDAYSGDDGLVAEQIALLGQHVLPRVRAELAPAEDA